jgi:hypothetical protein
MWPNKQLKLQMKNNKRWHEENTIECEFMSIDIINSEMMYMKEY